MISRTKAKFIKSLQLKKFRNQEGAFVVQGTKSALELINADFSLLMLLATNDFIKKHSKQISNCSCEMIEVSENELSSLGYFKTSTDVLLVAKTKPNTLGQIMPEEYILVLDDIRDPGNMGTIVRIADWYGIRQIVASENSSELYNPKVLQASMGSFARINIFYTNLELFFNERKEIKIYGALLEGDNIHHVEFSKGGALLIGNESKGIDNRLLPFIHHKITIPRYGEAESLNAAIATAVICDRMRFLVPLTKF